MNQRVVRILTCYVFSILWAVPSGADPLDPICALPPVDSAQLRPKAVKYSTTLLPLDPAAPAVGKFQVKVTSRGTSVVIQVSGLPVDGQWTALLDTELGPIPIPLTVASGRASVTFKGLCPPPDALPINEVSLLDPSGLLFARSGLSPFTDKYQATFTVSPSSASTFSMQKGQVKLRHGLAGVNLILTKVLDQQTQQPANAVFLLSMLGEDAFGNPINPTFPVPVISGTARVKDRLPLELRYLGSVVLFDPQGQIVAQAGVGTPTKFALAIEPLVGLDAQGRVFTSFDPDPDNNPATNDGQEQDNVQYAILRATVVPALGAKVPAGSQIQWNLSDPDDPATHATIDANGNTGNDNSGGLDGAAHFFQGVAHFPTANEVTAAPNTGSAQTPVTNGESRVRLNVTDDGGDNFTLRASLVDATGTPVKDSMPTTLSRTITVWRRATVWVYAMSRHTGALVYGPLGDFGNRTAANGAYTKFHNAYAGIEGGQTNPNLNTYIDVTLQDAPTSATIGSTNNPFATLVSSTAGEFAFCSTDTFTVSVNGGAARPIAFSAAALRAANMITAAQQAAFAAGFSYALPVQGTATAGAGLAPWNLVTLLQNQLAGAAVNVSASTRDRLVLQSTLADTAAAPSTLVLADTSPACAVPGAGALAGTTVLQAARAGGLQFPALGASGKGLFAVANNDRMDLSVDAGANQAVIFNMPAANAGRRTPAEVVAELNADAAGQASANIQSRVVIRSNTNGAASRLTITDGAGTPARFIGLGTHPNGYTELRTVLASQLPVPYHAPSEPLHDYALHQTDFHADNAGTHLDDTIQLIGIALHEGVFGDTILRPHAFIATLTRESTVAYLVSLVGPFAGIAAGDTFQMTLQLPGVTVGPVNVVFGAPPAGGFTAANVVTLITNAVNAALANLAGEMSSGRPLRVWATTPDGTRVVLQWDIGMPPIRTITIQDTVGTPALILGLNPGVASGSDEGINKTAIHEIGHAFDTGTALNYHTAHTAGFDCVARQGYIKRPYFCPIHVRQLRNTINRQWSAAHVPTAD